MMALTQENVHYTLNSVPGVKGSYADPGIFVRRGGGGGGGGVGGGGGWSRPDGQKTVWTIFF